MRTANFNPAKKIKRLNPTFASFKYSPPIKAKEIETARVIQ